MRIFLAGGAGAIGRCLVPRLIARGYTVVVLTRTTENAERIERLGAQACFGDALDRAAMQRIIADFRPDVVIDQLTALPKRLNPKTIAQDTAATNRLRTRGTGNLMEAARKAGVRRFIAQSIAFAYDPPNSPAPVTEGFPLYYDAPGGFDATVDAVDKHERSVLNSPGIDGIIMRYGYFYGPGTAYAPDGSLAQDIRKRRFPIVGNGQGVFSFIHIEDAANATIVALERGAPGVYNIVDNEPAPVSEWLPYLADLIGAPEPLHLPVWLASWLAGPFGIHMLTRQPGASNARARRELGWTPEFQSWRDGFRAVFCS
jgi:nucleoside-diphosphate-sugar epimerase